MVSKLYRIVFIHRQNKVLTIIGFLLFALICSVFKINKKDNVVAKTNNLYFNKSQQNILLSTGDVLSKSELHVKLLRAKVERIAKKVKTSRSIILNTKPVFEPNYNVHVFYYAWYANKEIDGYYGHWNHRYLPNWQNDQKVNELGSHEPILDIGSNFYPSLGCYSSQDASVIDAHMKQLKESGIGVIVVSWSPPNTTDSPYKVLPLLFKYAKKHSLKIALHIEPYFDRNPVNLMTHLQNYLLQYKSHPALYKIKKADKEMPLFYVYDSYLTPAVAWTEILSAKGTSSIRHSKLDAVFIGLLVDIQHRYHIKKSHFDGFYTYFATNSFSYGSTWKNWKSLSKFAAQNGLIFVPSVGPGYADTQVRPWNSKNTRHRRHGQYYDVAWRTAISSTPKFVSITSFNEWHEGTQIEPAIPKSVSEFSYLDYEPEGSHFYLNLTKWWIEQFSKSYS